LWSAASSLHEAIHRAWLEGATILVVPARFPLQGLEPAIRDAVVPIATNQTLSAYRRIPRWARPDREKQQSLRHGLQGDPGRVDIYLERRQ